MASVHCITYDEDLWFRYDDAQRQACKDAWLRKYDPVEDYHTLVLKLIPDSLFPRNAEKPLPYIEWQVDLAARRKPVLPYEIAANVRITLSEDADLYRMRGKIDLALREYPNGTRYQVFNHGCDKPVLQGVVTK